MEKAKLFPLFLLVFHVEQFKLVGMKRKVSQVEQVKAEKATVTMILDPDWNQAIEELLAKVKEGHPLSEQTKTGLVQRLFYQGANLAFKDWGIERPDDRKAKRGESEPIGRIDKKTGAR